VQIYECATCFLEDKYRVLINEIFIESESLTLYLSITDYSDATKMDWLYYVAGVVSIVIILIIWLNLFCPLTKLIVCPKTSVNK